MKKLFIQLCAVALPVFSGRHMGFLSSGRLQSFRFPSGLLPGEFYLVIATFSDSLCLPVFSLTATATPQSIMQKIADTGKLANWQETSGNAGIPAALCLKSARNATLKTTGNIAEGL